MVARINHTDILVITWGSTLTNMCFLKPGVKVLILKSASYMHETIELFRKIIQARQIHVSVIEADDNVIDTDRIHKWLNENGLITTDDATNKNLHTEEQENTAEKAGI